eukprot:5094439-Pleurochrysis_carterae.AAC.1
MQDLTVIRMGQPLVEAKDASEIEYSFVWEGSCNRILVDAAIGRSDGLVASGRPRCGLARGRVAPSRFEAAFGAAVSLCAGCGGGSIADAAPARPQVAARPRAVRRRRRG